MSRNAEVAARLEEYANYLDAKGVDYKPRAYRRAADNVRDYPEAIEDLAAEGQEAVEEIEGVGDAIAGKIVEYVETGEIEELEALREELPVKLGELLAVEGVGPKTIGDLYGALGIRTLDDLERAAEAGEIREVSGFGAKTEQNILENVEFARRSRERGLLGEAMPLGRAVRDYLAASDAVGRCDSCGSLRRWRETIGDVDVLCEATGVEDAEDPEDALQAVVDEFTAWDRASDVIEAGSNKASVRASGERVDLRVVVPSEYGSALQYFTGSKEHNIRFRNHAIRQDKKVNEYGVFDVSSEALRASGSRTESGDDVDDPDAGEGTDGSRTSSDSSDGTQRAGERIAGETEAGMYEAVGLPWMPPELREDRGEIQAAVEGRLPDLVEEGEVRGDLHTHTTWSDGSYDVGQMVAGAAEFGHDYVAVSDHAEGPGMVGGVGLSDDELRDQMGEIRAVAEDAPTDVFAGVEANVDAAGDLSTGDDVLADLDLVVASPHSALDQGGDAATDRLVRAVEHPSVDVLGHPSGRLINQRAGLDFDVERVAEAAVDAGTALEVNANPHRLDLWGAAVQVAVEAGATVAVNTDAHSPGEYEYVTYGVHTARRGWAETGDVLNARDADGVREFLH
jgi:DNA polymerase (family 10)